MLIEQTLEKLNAMKLGAMAEAVQQQLRSDDAATLSFEDRLGLLVDAEWTAREQRKLQRRLHTAKLRYATAALEAVESLVLGPLFGLFVVLALAANIGQVGLIFAPKKLQPKLNKISLR